MSKILDKSFLIAIIPTEQHRMKNRVNNTTTTTPAMMARIKLNNKTNKRYHRKENRNLHYSSCHSLKQQQKSAFTVFGISNSQMSLSLARKHLWFIILLTIVIHHVDSLEMTTTSSHSSNSSSNSSTSTSLGKSTTRYSQLLSTNGQMMLNANNVKTEDGDDDDDDTFRPFIPKDPEVVSRNVFTPSGQFRVFQPIDTDLRATVALEHRSHKVSKMSEPLFTSATTSSTAAAPKENQKQQPKQFVHHPQISQTNLSKEKPLPPNSKQNVNNIDVHRNEISKQDDLTSDLKSLEDLLVEYVTNFFEKGQYQPVPGLVVELQNNHSIPLANSQQEKIRNVRHVAATGAKISVDLPRTMATGRLLFLTGLKKVLWPVFMGLQVLKSLLIAMFIPAIIGSFTKLLGKGITTGSAPLFIRPMEAPQELDFRDNSLNFDDDNKFLALDDGVKENGPYAYNQPDASQMHNQYAYGQASPNQLAFTRLGMNERQHQLMQDSYMSALQSIGSASFKNSGSLSSGSSGLLAPMANKPMPTPNVNTFQQFQKVPDSSLLLSNYDPFYSPLLSRLDSVFAQLKINADKEVCREKLICLMYANPAKYAPYSNLVSAQLSRELNELRKPTSDNPDILRFFKYMRAAKDGQDGVDCSKTFDKCEEFKDFENPAMVSTYHDINKLVQARKLT